MIRYPYCGQGPEGFDKAEGSYDKDFHHRLLHSMERIRIFEETIESKYHEDQMQTPIHLVIGHEAANVGACEALKTEDLVYTSHRTHGVYLAKGGDMNAMAAEFFCKTTGCAGSRGGSMHLLDKKAGFAGGSAIVGGSVPHAVGAALAMKKRGEDRVAVAFCGDAGMEEGAFWESANFAATHKLPVIFFCENNFYSVFTPLWQRQPEGTSLTKKAEAFGVKGEEVDGTNVLLSYEAMQRAVEACRKGEGPRFVEAFVGRWRGHGGAGDDSHKGYRSPEEVQDWMKYCPVEMYAGWLEGKGLLETAEREASVKAIHDEVAAALKFGADSPIPDPSTVLDHIYAP